MVSYCIFVLVLSVQWLCDIQITSVCVYSEEANGRLASPDRAVTRVSAYTLLAVCTVTSLFIIA